MTVNSSLQQNGIPVRPYQPFCVLGIPRCGSNLLQSLLNAHPDIMAHGEVFGTTPAKKYSLRWNQLPRTPYDGSSYSHFLATGVFPPEAEHKRAVGFKLFPAQLQPAPEGKEQAWAFIRGIPGMRFIRLARRNIVDIALSMEIAKRDNAWVHVHASMSPAPAPIAIDPHVLVWQCRQIEQKFALIDTMLEGSPFCPVWYEDLTQKTEETLARVQQWLQVPVRTLQPSVPVRKFRTRTRREILENFEEVRAFCAREYPQLLMHFDEPEDLIEVRRTDQPAFYMQLYRDGDLARAALTHLRRSYPHARAILQSDGDNDPAYPALAREFRCEYFAGERLFPVENGGKLLQRMLNDFLSGPGTHLIRIDTDTRIDRPFSYLPGGNAVFGNVLRAGPPQGGCIILPREAAARLRDSRIFLSPSLTRPEQSWGAAMKPSFLQERIRSTGCIGFEWTLYWACRQLDMPILPHAEVHATWKEGHLNADRTYAVVHPDKFLTIDDRLIHAACTTAHSKTSGIYLAALYQAA